MLLAPSQDVFDHVLVRPADDGSGLVHLTWRAAAQGDRLVQVYVDGQLYDTSTHTTQRAMWLQVDPTRPHAVELLAVPLSLRWEAMPEQLRGWDQPFVIGVEHATPRDESLPIDSRVTVRVDGELITDDALWSVEDHRGGFGGLHGEGPFGFDLATAPGSGSGDFGFGSFGSGGEAWRWVGLLPPGDHAVEFDAGGQMETIAVAVDEIDTAITPSTTGDPVVLSW